MIDRVPRLAGKDHRFVDILWSIEGHQGYIMKLLSFHVCYLSVGVIWKCDLIDKETEEIRKGVIQFSPCS